MPELLAVFCVFDSTDATVRMFSARYRSSVIQYTHATTMLMLNRGPWIDVEWEKALWTHSINLNAIFLDRILLCWNVRALLHESAVITSQRQLLNLSIRMHSNCPCRPWTIQTSEKCSLFSFDARTKIEFFHISLSHRHWRRRSSFVVADICNSKSNCETRETNKKKLIVNEIRTQSRRRIEETEERLHFSERRTHTHIQNSLHWTWFAYENCPSSFYFYFIRRQGASPSPIVIECSQLHAEAANISCYVLSKPCRNRIKWMKNSHRTPAYFSESNIER